MFFPDGRVEDYNGGRTASDIVQQALTMFEEVAEPPELYQLLGQDTIDSACADVQVNYNDSYNVSHNKCFFPTRYNGSLGLCYRLRSSYFGRWCSCP